MAPKHPCHPPPFPSQACLGKDLGPGPVRGKEEPLLKCQTPSHLCLPHSSHLERKTKVTGNPRGSVAPSLQTQAEALAITWKQLGWAPWPAGLSAPAALGGMEILEDHQSCGWTLFKKQGGWLLMGGGGGPGSMPLLHPPPSLVFSAPP